MSTTAEQRRKAATRTRNFLVIEREEDLYETELAACDTEAKANLLAIKLAEHYHREMPKTIVYVKNLTTDTRISWKTDGVRVWAEPIED